MFQTKIIFNNNVYIKVKDIKEELGISIKTLKKDCEIIKIPEFGNALFIAEKELQQYNYYDKTIVFDVCQELKESIRTSIKAGEMINYFAGGQMSVDRIIDKSVSDIKKNFILKQEIYCKKLQEYIQNQEKINEINNVLEDLGNNIRWKQFVFIDKDLNLSNRILICGNGYFKQINEIENIIIPAIDYGTYDGFFDSEKEKSDFISSLRNDKLYIFDECSEEEIDLSDSEEDDIDYDESYFNICMQLLQKYRLNVNIGSIGYIDFNSDDFKISFFLTDNDAINFLLLGNNQDLYFSYEYRYPFSIEKAEALLEQFSDKEYRKIIEKTEYEIS